MTATTTITQEQVVQTNGVTNGTATNPNAPKDLYMKKIKEIGTDYYFKRKIVWFNTIGFVFLHLAALYGFYLIPQAKILTIIWMLAFAAASGEGVTIGAHRLYSHKSFKATPFTRLVLLILQTIAGQNCMYIWVRDHRLHHKYSDTDADPHNAHRGFFFSHMGWLMSRKHPQVILKGRTIDMSDLEADKLVMLQMKYYHPLYVIFAIALPVLVPLLFWAERWHISLFCSYFARYILVLHITWCVNSVAHFFGTKPFDKKMRPVESHFVSFIGFGEGWHNYHHAFPWDYRAAELGSKFNVTTYIIDVLAYFGFIYDLKSAPYSMIERRAKRTGDGTHIVFNNKTMEQKSKELANAGYTPKDFNDVTELAENNVRLRASASQG